MSLKFNLPNVHGIVCTAHDFLCYIDNDQTKNITRIPSVPKEMKELDKKILINFLKQFKETSTLFVVGENTYQDMKFLKCFPFDGFNADFLLSSQDDPVTIQKAYDKALHLGCTDIVVLGGRSTYKAFCGVYSQFVLCDIEFSDNPLSGCNGKTLTIDEVIHGERFFVRDTLFGYTCNLPSTEHITYKVDRFIKKGVEF